jgi:hypothetical protein
MSDLRFLLDENIGHDLFNALTRHWPEMDVWAVGDPGAPRRKAPDPEILIWCEAKQFALVTYNRASMPVHLKDHLAAGRYVSGIFVLRGHMSIGQIVEALGTIWLTAEPDEYADQITYVKPPAP